MENNLESIASRLRKAMDARGKKQADLVRETGLDRGSISSYLSGKYEPKSKAIFKLSQALDVNEAWLQGHEVPMERTPESKKNDQLAKLIVRLRTDEGFFSTVSNLAELTAEQYHSIELLVSTLKK